MNSTAQFSPVNVYYGRVAEIRLLFGIACAGSEDFRATGGVSRATANGSEFD